MRRGAAALRDGVRRVNRAPALVAATCGVTLLIALPLSIALRGMLEAHLGHSIAAEAVASRADYGWWREFEGQATGLGTTFGPSVGGFGAVLRNVSGLLDNQPLATTIVGATAAWLLIWSFLSGGIIDRLARDRSTRTSGFFAACGVHVWRLLRLGLIAAVVYYVLFGLVHPWIFDDVYPALTDEVTVERTAFIIRLGGYALFAALLAFFTTLFDYARIRLVIEERRSALGAFAAGARFVRRHLPSVSCRLPVERGTVSDPYRPLRAAGSLRPRSGNRSVGRPVFRSGLHRHAPLLEVALLRLELRAVPVGPRAHRLYGGAEAGLAGIPGG